MTGLPLIFKRKKGTGCGFAATCSLFPYTPAGVAVIPPKKIKVFIPTKKKSPDIQKIILPSVYSNTTNPHQPEVDEGS